VHILLSTIVPQKIAGTFSFPPSDHSSGMKKSMIQNALARVPISTSSLCKRGHCSQTKFILDIINFLLFGDFTAMKPFIYHIKLYVPRGTSPYIAFQRP
jgi:hypothetical protein